MHIKQKPDDFRVEEITRCRPETKGDYALYRLEKKGWTTLDALAIVRKRWKIEPRRVAFGGLKDRHAETTQYFTIYRGPGRKLTHTNLHVTYLGKLAKAYDSQDIDANRFTVTVRSMNEDEINVALRALDEVRGVGLPNYYDDQRFGSVVHGGAFFAYQLLIGEWEAALHMALTAPYAFERGAQKNEKATLRRHWGDWRLCRQMLPRKEVVTYLFANPTDFRGALERLPAELRTLYLSAYQSYLWNRMLADWLADHIPAKDLTTIALKLGEVPMPMRVPSDVREELSTLALPLHSARIHIEEGDPRKVYFDRVLKDEEVTQDQFKLKGFRALFFSKGERAAWCMPRNLEARDARDEEHRGKQKLTLKFELPRGSYATLLVKRITRIAEADGD